MENANYSRLFDLLPQYVAKNNKPDTFAYKVNGEWVKFSGIDTINIVNNLSLGLLQLGLGKDDKVAIISPNRPEWNFIELAVQQIGGVSVPMYPTITIEDYRYIFNDAGVKAVFVGNQDLYNKAKKASEGMSHSIDIYTFDKIDGLKNWREVEAMGKTGNVADLEPHKAKVTTNDLLTLIYTSGTTGTPKGVMLTHSNIISNVEGVLEYLKLVAGEVALSFLPLCHIYERTVIYIYMRQGVSVYYAENMETIVPNLQEIKPTVFTTVPRLLEKIYDKIVSKGHELTGIKRSIFFWALNIGLRYDPATDMGWWYNLQLKWARKLIFSKWKEALGGNLKVISSGAAALQQRLSRVFWAAGIPIAEGYGLTETSPVISTSMVEPFDMRVGCVGTIIKGVTVKFADDGEILVKGPNVMKGYYNKPEATAETIDADGWFHTGDIGTLVEGRYLKITDRKKEIFKTSGGKYVSPQMVENKLKESRFVEQAVVVGEGQKFPSTLIVPTFDTLKDWCHQNGVEYTLDSDMITKEPVLKLFEQEIAEANKTIAQYEKVKRFCLLPTLLSIDGGELTPTLKLKRKIIHAKYNEQIESMYDK